MIRAICRRALHTPGASSWFSTYAKKAPVTVNHATVLQSAKRWNVNVSFTTARSFATDESSVSPVFKSVATGERLTGKEFEELRNRAALFVKPDGTTENLTLQQCVERGKVEKLDPVLVRQDDKMLVVKLMDAGKMRHQMQKKKKEAIKKSETSVLKEVRLGLNIGQHDLDFKMKQAREFLSKNNKVKLYIQLRGAEFYRSQNKAGNLLKEISVHVKEVGVPEEHTTMTGNVISLFVNPMKQTKKNKPDPKAKQDSSPLEA
eukprot:761911-Hanusia_phi.AAC.1